MIYIYIYIYILRDVYFVTTFYFRYFIFSYLLSKLDMCMAIGTRGVLGAIEPPFPQKKKEKGSKLNYPFNTICLI